MGEESEGRTYASADFLLVTGMDVVEGRGRVTEVDGCGIADGGKAQRRQLRLDTKISFYVYKRRMIQKNNKKLIKIVLKNTYGSEISNGYGT